MNYVFNRAYPQLGFLVSAPPRLAAGHQTGSIRPADRRPPPPATHKEISRKKRRRILGGRIGGGPTTITVTRRTTVICAIIIALSAIGMLDGWGKVIHLNISSAVGKQELCLALKKSSFALWGSRNFESAKKQSRHGSRMRKSRHFFRNAKDANMLCIRMWHSLSPKKVSTKTERLKIFRPSTGRLLPSLQFGDFTAYFSSLQPRLLCISSSLEGKEGEDSS